MSYQNAMNHPEQPKPDLRSSADALTPRIKSLVESLYIIHGRLFAPSPKTASAGVSANGNVVGFEQPTMDVAIDSARHHLDDADEVVKMILDRL